MAKLRALVIMPTAFISLYTMKTILVIVLPMLFLSGCAVYTVADAAVSVAATTVKVAATVVETTVDVAASGVKAVTQSSKEAAD